MTPIFVLQQISPNISSNIDEITCYKHHHIIFIAVLHPSNSQPWNDSSQRHEIYHSIPHHCLIACEATFYEDANIPHFSWNLVCDNGDNYRHIDIGVSCTKSNSNSKSIKEVMNEGGEKVQITCSLLPPQRLKASLLDNIVALRGFNGLCNIFLLLILVLFIVLQAIRMLMLMTMMIMLILSPMMMCYS